MNARRPVDLQRVRHIPRELLRSQDLRVQQEASDQRRWWHNRALHEATGVTSGLTVALTENKRAVVVQPGIGYDCFGHELLVSAPRTVPLPVDQQPMTLVACFRGHGSSAEATLHWQPAGGDTLDTHCTPLADLSYEDNNGAVVRTASPRSRPLARPRIGYGETPAEGTPWQLWTMPSSDGDIPLGLQVSIDTGAAGFTEVPCYFAWLQWPQVADSHLPYLLYLALGFQYLEEPTIDRFVFRVLPPGLLFVGESAVQDAALIRESHGEALILSLARGQRLAVCWLGIQHEPRQLDQPGAAHQEGA